MTVFSTDAANWAGGPERWRELWLCCWMVAAWYYIFEARRQREELRCSVSYLETRVSAYLKEHGPLRSS